MNSRLNFDRPLLTHDQESDSPLYIRPARQAPRPFACTRVGVVNPPASRFYAALSAILFGRPQGGPR